MVFGSAYSSLYDCLYSDHDYDADAKVVDHIISEYHSKQSRRSLLDLGCGTGQHSVRLKGDYDVIGVDQSEGMLIEARKKSPDLTFIQGDAKDFKLDKKVDVVLMMSAVLGYMHSNDDVLKTMKNVRSHLNDNGMFIFDVWNGPAVLMEKPTERLKEISHDGVHLIRVVKPTLNPEMNIVICNYKWWFSAEGKIEPKTETHQIRYFFPMEMRLFLQLAGFKLLRIGQPSTFYRGVEPGSWHAMYVCQAL